MNFYLNKYGFQSPKITELPLDELALCVVIPCFNEPDLIPSLKSLQNCDDTVAAVEIIVVINAGIQETEAIKKQNQVTFEKAIDWSIKNNTPKKTFHILLEQNLPKKHAGVGLARKIGMDEAVARFDKIAKDGIIVCFDADSLCDSNYLTAIEKHFKKHVKTPGCSIHYEHPLSGEEHPDLVYKGIINYELHLRYYNQGLRFAGLPFAYHTVGSSMAVRSSAYQKQGGMNKRKAGEDFYFIHKIIELGGFTELKTTKVIPSPRISDRVPFGTGKAIGDWIESKSTTYKTYAFESFELLKVFVHNVPAFYAKGLEEVVLDASKKEVLQRFLESQKWQIAIDEIRKNSKTQMAFEKRFFRWFDAFKVLKLMHFLRDNGADLQSVYQESKKIIKKINPNQVIDNEYDQLVFLREFEKK